MLCVMSAISTLQLTQSDGTEVARHRKPKTQVEKRTWGIPPPPSTSVRLLKRYLSMRPIGRLQ
jgi:hypothetical protein